jgi:hypothetical protein
MSAGPFLADRLITWFWPWGRQKLDALPHRRQVFLWLMVAGVFWSGFLAWRDEKQKHAVAPLNPLMLYQGGFPVADVGKLSSDAEKDMILFDQLTAVNVLDMSSEFEFRDWKMMCSGDQDGSFSYGAMRRISYLNVSCRIQGLR